MTSQLYFKLIPALLIILTAACNNNTGSTEKPNRRAIGNQNGANGGGTVPQVPNPAPAPNPGNPSPIPNPNPIPQPPPTIPPAPQTATDCYKASPFVCKVERLITDKTNKYRASVGKKPLAYDPKASFIARDWSAKQANSGRISHSGFPSVRGQAYRQEFQVSRSFSAENVAMTGYGDSGESDAAAESVAEDFATMWWTSSGHRANMVGNYSNLGMGMAQSSDGSWYGTQIFD